MRYSTSVWGNQKKWIKQAFHPDSPSYPLPNRRCRCLYSLANTPALVGCNKPKGFRCSMTLATAVVPQMLDDKRGDLYGYCNTCPRVPCAFLHFWYLNIINKNEKNKRECKQAKAKQNTTNNTQEQPEQQQERATTATDQQTNQPTNQPTNKQTNKQNETKRNQTKQNKTNKQTKQNKTKQTNKQTKQNKQEQKLRK